MEEMKNKINPLLIVIIILILAVGVFAYDKWGNGFLSSKDDDSNLDATVVDIDTSVSKMDIVIGSQDAPVTIVEYFSYFCGYCELFHSETYPKIVENYISQGKVKFVIRVFPPFELGVSTLCALEQDKFTEYHNLLFEKASEIEKAEDLVGLAQSIDLDFDKFNQCFNSQEKLTQAENWYNQGQIDFENAGIAENQRGTPAFIINGEMLVGAQPYEAFVDVIERKLVE